LGFSKGAKQFSVFLANGLSHFVFAECGHWDEPESVFGSVRWLSGDGICVCANAKAWCGERRAELAN
ncbi:MAG: hypothetical protein AAFZ17_18905, partial [Cyanobacteria bacterium J06650_10]